MPVIIGQAKQFFQNKTAEPDGSRVGPDVPERLAAVLAQVRDRTGAVPMADSEQGTLEVGKSMKAHGH